MGPHHPMQVLGLRHWVPCPPTSSQASDLARAERRRAGFHKLALILVPARSELGHMGKSLGFWEP